MKHSDEALTEAKVWEEVAKVSEELYSQYLELNELGLNTAIVPESEQLDFDRNWDVPIGINVTGEAQNVELVGSS